MRLLGSVSFLYFRHSDVYILFVTRQNANAMLAFSFMKQVRFSAVLCVPALYGPAQRHGNAAVDLSILRSASIYAPRASSFLTSGIASADAVNVNRHSGLSPEPSLYADCGPVPVVLRGVLGGGH